MTLLISEAQRRRYRRDGLLFPVSVLNAEEVCRFRAACESLEAQLGGRPRTVDVRQMHLHFDWAYELATHSRVLDAVEALLGPNLLVWATELFAKPPRDSAVSIGWHRDRPYMGFDARTCTTAWIALSDSTIENGCLRAIPGAGRSSAAVEEAKAIDVPLKAGEMSLHDPEILHGSSPNRSEQKRIGFAIRFVTPEARPPIGSPPAVLARGRDPYQHFHVVRPCVMNEGGQALAAMKQSAMRHLETVLENLKACSS